MYTVYTLKRATGPVNGPYLPLLYLLYTLLSSIIITNKNTPIARGILYPCYVCLFII